MASYIGRRRIGFDMPPSWTNQALRRGGAGVVVDHREQTGAGNVVE